MSRPGKTESNPAAKDGVKRRLILGTVHGHQSRSLLANVLNESDLHLRYRSSRTQSNSAEHRPCTSGTGIQLDFGDALPSLVRKLTINHEIEINAQNKSANP